MEDGRLNLEDSYRTVRRQLKDNQRTNGERQTKFRGQLQDRWRTVRRQLKDNQRTNGERQSKFRGQLEDRWRTVRRQLKDNQRTNGERQSKFRGQLRDSQFRYLYSVPCCSTVSSRSKGVKPVFSSVVHGRTLLQLEQIQGDQLYMAVCFW